MGMKTDAYLDRAFEDAPQGGFEAAEPAALPVLVRLKDTGQWVQPAGFETHTKLGNIISGNCTHGALRSLEGDDNVESIEASRPAGLLECATSVPFLRATRVHGSASPEKGNRALVGIIDSGIDVLHEAFQDGSGNSRVVEIWDQTDPTGPTPKGLNPAQQANYGSVHTAAVIQSYLTAGAVPARLGRDPNRHGTHVASIAAGRAAGAFAGGVAPEAKIVLVIAQLSTGQNDPSSIGYSRSHVDALAYIKQVAAGRAEPVVVNVSLGMNAGAHDGTSLLEAGFDAFSGGGRDPGLVVVKSAGNERSMDGHAKLTLGTDGADDLRWSASPAPRGEDVFELWFKATDEMKFRLRDPAGDVTPWCTWATPLVKGSFPSGNTYALEYTRRHHDNGDSRLLVLIRPGTAAAIRPGAWRLDVEAGQVPSEGVIHAWVERINTRPVKFTNHQDEEITLSIPGTARSVITVAAVNSALPLLNTSTSSYGLTRDEREKPDVVAPGTGILAAQAGTTSGAVAMTGTSMAAPHVTGAVALLLSAKAKTATATSPIPSAAQVRTALCQGAQNFNGFHTRNNGYGLADAESLLAAFP